MFIAAVKSAFLTWGSMGIHLLLESVSSGPLMNCSVWNSISISFIFQLHRLQLGLLTWREQWDPADPSWYGGGVFLLSEKTFFFFFPYLFNTRKICRISQGIYVQRQRVEFSSIVDRMLQHNQIQKRTAEVPFYWKSRGKIFFKQKGTFGDGSL